MHHYWLPWSWRVPAEGHFPWKCSYFTVKVLAWFHGWDSSSRIPISDACPSNLLSIWIWERQSRKSPFVYCVSDITTQSAQRILFKNFETCIHLTGISQESDVLLSRGRAWQFLGWIRLGVCLQGAYGIVQKTVNRLWERWWVLRKGK